MSYNLYMLCFCVFLHTTLTDFETADSTVWHQSRICDAMTIPSLLGSLSKASWVLNINSVEVPRPLLAEDVIDAVTPLF